MIVLGVDYHRFDLPPEILNDPSRGIIARYAWGDDYHEIIRPLLFELDAAIRKISGRTAQGKGLVDTGPVLERDWAMQAGLGFTGKNCCTIHPVSGSWMILATLLVPEEVGPGPRTPPHPGGRLRPQGRRRRPAAQDQSRLLATPQSPIPNPQSPIHLRFLHPLPHRLPHGRLCRPPAPGPGPLHLVLDHRSPLPHPPRTAPALRQPHLRLRHLPGGLPVEQAAGRTHAAVGRSTRPGGAGGSLFVGRLPQDNPYWLDQSAFSAHFRRSPIKRAKRAGMLRNVCVALGNWGDVAAIPALSAALADVEPMARIHAAWGLGQLLVKQNDERAATILRDALAGEADERVAAEIRLAL